MLGLRIRQRAKSVWLETYQMVCTCESQDCLFPFLHILHQGLIVCTLVAPVISLCQVDQEIWNKDSMAFPFHRRKLLSEVQLCMHRWWWCLQRENQHCCSKQLPCYSKKSTHSRKKGSALARANLWDVCEEDSRSSQAAFAILWLVQWPWFIDDLKNVSVVSCCV